MPVVRSQAAEGGAAASCTESSLLTEIPSGFEFMIGFLSGVKGQAGGGTGACGRFASELCMLEPDVARHARGCKQQRAERDEKANHQPAHGNKRKRFSNSRALPTYWPVCRNWKTAVGQNTRRPAPWLGFYGRRR